jgi:prefoldin subunit 2|tara:strand:- start:97 stop:387 length:291 start_codon:yes stop_codon:yes gene_type:complete
VSRLLELQDEAKENELVMESLMKLEDGRRCWRLVNGVLFEKTKQEVVPELKSMIHNCNNICRQLNDTLVFKKQESFKIEQAYESIMKAAKARQADA